MDKVLKKEDFKHYLDNVNGVLPTQDIEIEVAGLAIGDELSTEWTNLNSINYDPKSDEIIVDVSDDYQHTIRNPVELVIAEGDQGVRSFTVKCAHGHLHILKFRKALSL